MPNSNPDRAQAVPNTENRAVWPYVRKPNAAYRTREYLTEAEVDRLIMQARQSRNGHRDATMILVCFRHGLRAIELVDLRWDQVDLDEGNLHIKRVKGSTDGVHPLPGDEMRALRRLPRSSNFVFMSEHGAQFTTAGFASLVARLGKRAGFSFKIHPHMLRHATGYALANKGMDTRSLQDYLGHKNINNTVRYTKIAPVRFRNIWDKPAEDKE